MKLMTSNIIWAGKAREVKPVMEDELSKLNVYIGRFKS